MGRPDLTCPACGHDMTEDRCHVQCPRCGFFHDCSDGMI